MNIQCDQGSQGEGERIWLAPLKPEHWPVKAPLNRGSPPAHMALGGLACELSPSETNARMHSLCRHGARSPWQPSRAERGNPKTDTGRPSWEMIAEGSRANTNTHRFSFQSLKVCRPKLNFWESVLLCVAACLTVWPLSWQLAYCVVQFMEKDATVTEYVRLFFIISYLMIQSVAFNPH